MYHTVLLKCLHNGSIKMAFFIYGHIYKFITLLVFFFFSLFSWCHCVFFDFSFLVQMADFRDTDSYLPFIHPFPWSILLSVPCILFLKCMKLSSTSGVARQFRHAEMGTRPSLFFKWKCGWYLNNFACYLFQCDGEGLLFLVCLEKWIYLSIYT